MYYPEELIEEVRMKNDIVDVISGYVDIRKKGSSYMGLCPFHNERTPSFSVSPGRQIFHCFGCGAGGNVFTFVMEYENLTFQEAVKLLADRAGVALPETGYDEKMRQKDSQRARLLALNKEAATFFYYQLRGQGGEIGYKYLQGRELSDDTIKRFGLGFAPVGGNLSRYLKGKGYEDKLLIEAGISGFDEKKGLYDKFWNRVIFPIQDTSNRVIGFGGRVMGDGKPKYLNSPETLVFDKSKNLYGLNLARQARTDNMILCEGYMDVIAMHQAGFTQAVASLGTSFTEGQAALLRRYVKEVILAYDSDGAGVRAALRAIGILKGAGLPGRVLDLQPYKDPDEFIKNLGQEAFKKRLRQAENSFFFELRMLERDFDLGDPEGRTRFHREIARKLCGFSEEVERENYMAAVAERYHIGLDGLRKLVVSYAAQDGGAVPAVRPRSGIQKKASLKENKKKPQKMLLAWLLEERSLYPKIKKYISPKDFEEGVYRKVAEKLFEGLEAGSFQPAAVVSLFEDEEEQKEASAIFHAGLIEPESRQEQEKTLHNIVMAVKQSSLERYLKEAGTDVLALKQAVEGKKALEELSKTHISLD